MMVGESAMKAMQEVCSCSASRLGTCPYCLDGIVLEKGIDALRAIPATVDQHGTHCIRCDEVIHPARMEAVKNANTCIGCQEHFDRVSRDRLRVLAARAAKPSGVRPGGPGDGNTPRSTRGRLLRAAPSF